MLLAVFAIAITLVLWLRGRWSAVLVGVLSTVAIGLLGGHFLGWDTVVNGSSLIPGVGTAAVGEFDAPDFGLVGEVFTALDGFSSTLVPSFIAVVLSLVMVDMFDTTGTILSVGDKAGMLEDGRAKDGIEKAMTADAASTVAGAVVGVTTITSFIESNVGIAAGARTGLMSVVVGILFAASLFLVPVLSVVTPACIAGALLLVGLLMASTVMKIDWRRPENAVAAALTIFMMGLSGSVTDGIALGFLGYGLAMTVTGHYLEMPRIVRVLSWVFLGYFLLNYWVIPSLRICVVRLRIFLLKGGCDRMLSVNSGTDATATATSGAFAAMKESGMSLTVVSSTGTLSYDTGALETFSRQAADVTVSMKKDDRTALNQAQRAAIGDSTFVSVSAVSAGAYISDIGGSVTMTFAFDNQKGWSDFAVFYIDDQGNSERVDSVYDAVTGLITAVSGHHSVYAVLEVTEPLPEPSTTTPSRS